MAYEPDLDWQDNGPPGFTAARMRKMQHGIADAAQTADDALALVGSGGINTVDDDVKRIYNAGTVPEDGAQPGDLVLSAAPSAQGPAAIPGLFTWLDASATGAKDLSTVLPDVSGNDNSATWRDLSGQVPASVTPLNGLPSFFFGGNTRYSRPGTHTGLRTFSGVVRFDSIQSADQPLFYTGGANVIEFGVRGSSGNLYLAVGSTVVYDAPLAWGAGGAAHVSFVFSLGTTATLWLGGEQVASTAIPGSGYTTLAISGSGNGYLHAALGELAEHHGVEVDSSQAVELAEYYRAKWRV